MFEIVKTPFGSYDSCKLRDADTGETYNLGLVPFCILKGNLRTSDGYINEYTIQKYRHGNGFHGIIHGIR